MRDITVVITAIQAAIPNPIPAEFPEQLQDGLIILGAELRVIKRKGSYTPPEAANDSALWQELEVALYRYLPNPAGYEFAQTIATLAKGTNAAKD